jgi:hypothetical protein
MKNKNNQFTKVNYDFTSLYPHMVKSIVNDDIFKKIKRIQRTQKIKQIFDEEETKNLF